MTLDILHIVLGLIALAAAAAAFVFSQRKPPDTAHLTAELQERNREVAAIKSERDELRARAEKSERAEAAISAQLSAAEAMVDGEKENNKALAKQLELLRQQHAQSAADLASLKAKAEFAEGTLQTMKETFAAQSAEVMRAALSDLQKVEEDARAQREKLDREKFGAQLKPVADTLERFEKQVHALEQKRSEDVGGLKTQIEALMKASEQTQAEAKKLSSALRRGAGVQGRWGEQTLRNVLELAGLASRFDFEEQVHLSGEDGASRPDVTINLAGGGAFVVDAKCSLTAFLEAQDAIDDQSRDAAMGRHAASIKAHVSGLSGKTYWDQFKGRKSPDFVAMFVPGDSFLVAALDRVPDLMTDAMNKRVIIVTPTTLFALCKAVAYGWRVEEQAQNADEVARLGKDLYKRLAVMGGYVKALGGALDGAVAKYNQFIGSLDSQVLTQARKFEDLKVDHEAKELPELTPIENRVRASTKLDESGGSRDHSGFALEHMSASTGQEQLADPAPKSDAPLLEGLVPHAAGAGRRK